MTISRHFLTCAAAALCTFGLTLPALGADKPIQHDAEHYMLAAQHGARWSQEDKDVDKLLAELRAKHGGKPPNIVYILLDDLGFGEIGMPNMDVVRGYSTPNISAFADSGLSLQRIYSEPSCTPTRMAMMTGRYAVRTGMFEAKAGSAASIRRAVC